MMSMWKMREMVDKATNLVMNYTETEAKVREASNDDPWGPSGAQMQEIASFTFTYEQFPEVMGMLWKRMLQDNRTNWRRTYKSLLLLDYLIKNGSERVVTNAREHVYDLRSMENYAFVDENVSILFLPFQRNILTENFVSETKQWPKKHLHYFRCSKDYRHQKNFWIFITKN